MKIECAYTELIGIDSPKLIPNPKNPNKHPDDQIERLAKIIEFQGQRSPIVISKRSGFITKGHGRLLAIQKLGWEKIAVDFQDYESEAQEYADIVADNAIAEWSSLDLTDINQQILDIDPDFSIDLLGLKDFELATIEEFEPQSDEDEVPEVTESIVKRGDIWLLGKHRICCGDSTMIDDVEKLMNGEKADMVFTDPPYNVASESTNMASDVSKSMNDLKNSEWDKNFEIEPPIVNAISCSKDSATYYIFTSHWLFHRIMTTLKEYCDFSGYLVWSKPNPMPSLMKRHPTWNTELCCYGTRGAKRVVNFPKTGHFLSCREVVKKSDGTHPTQKPLELIEPLINFSSGENQLVLDLFLGSGSTLIACEKTNRKCYGMELDEKYVQVAIERWQNYTGKKSTLELTGETLEELKEKRKKISGKDN